MSSDLVSSPNPFVGSAVFYGTQEKYKNGELQHKTIFIHYILKEQFHRRHELIAQWNSIGARPSEVGGIHWKYYLTY